MPRHCGGNPELAHGKTGNHRKANAGKPEMI